MPMSTHSSPLSARWQARVHSRVVDTAAAAVPEVQLLWVTPCSASEMLGCDSIEECLYIPWIPTFSITTDPLTRLEVLGWTPFPTLSISDAERRAYHHRRVSDALNPQRIFDTMWILVRSDLSRLSATEMTCGRRVAPRCDRAGVWM